MAKSKKDRQIPRWFQDYVPIEISNSTIFKFQVKMPGGATVDIDLLQDLDINYEILEEHLETTPAQYQFWSSVYSELRSNVAALELKIKTRRNTIAARTIDKHKSENIKVTDKQLNYIIDSDKKLTEYEAQLTVTNKHVGKLYHMVKAIEMKSEHCRSLAGFKRQDKEQSAHTT